MIRAILSAGLSASLYAVLYAVFWAGPALLGTLATARAADQGYELIERGRYVATVSDCVACHSAPGGVPYAGGTRLFTPFGTLVGPNITPDKETGMGLYTEAEFRRVLREGIGRGEKRLYPAMPYPAFSKLSDDDITALYAYMMSIQPVRNVVEANQLPFPFNQRILMLGWNWLNFDPKPLEVRTDKPAEWNRGRYLVEAAGHCGACHTPKTMLGADDTSRALRGTSLQGWVAPDITGDRRYGVGRWSVEQIVQYLQNGSNGHSNASGPMAEEIQNSSSRMTEGDLRAIAVYLLDQEGRSGPAPTPVAATDPRMVAGAAIFKDRCSACHGDNGQGASYLFPRLADSGVVQADDPATLIHLVLAGSRAAATDRLPTAPAMPPFHWRFTDEQVASVLTYIRNSWGNAAPAVPPGDVGKLRAPLLAGE
ncbi:c-type cytochrome [Roseomonas elaeocarpi]|uniref:C-type cytochrome n=1 Tax=Roseomonas elaeocarpi TaxID=907779 RepID=A0ABV6JPR8_9PROT